MVNPAFVERDGTQLEEEGCLSAPGFNATVVRPARAVVKGLDRARRRSRRSKAPDLLARAFQHEMDHLDGVVFIDRLRGIKRDMIVRKIQKLQKIRQVVDRRLRIVFFGTPAFAVPTLEALLRSPPSRSSRVVSQPDRPRGRGQQLQPTPTKQSRSAHGIPVLQPAKIRDDGVPAGRSAISQPDLGVVAAFGRILPDALLAHPAARDDQRARVAAAAVSRRRADPARRPRRRRGDRRDDHARGDRARRRRRCSRWRRVPIPPDATSGEIEAAARGRSARSCSSDVVDAPGGRTRRRDAAGSRPGARYAREDHQGGGARSTGACPATIVHNQVRGLQPWPLASTRLRGSRVVLRKTTTDLAPSNGRFADLTPATRDLAPSHARTGTSSSSRAATAPGCASWRFSRKDAAR